MIKLGMMARETADATLEDTIGFAHELKLDAIDLHLSGMSRNPTYLHHLRTLCLRHGLTIGYAGSGSFVGPPREAGARMAQGYQDVDADGDTEYCDIDGHRNYGPQVIVTKMGNKVTIECIKSNNTQYCRGSSSAYIIFTSIEGLQEMIYCYMFDGAHQSLFHKCEATLGFEPASFEISYKFFWMLVNLIFQNIHWFRFFFLPY